MFTGIVMKSGQVLSAPLTDKNTILELKVDSTVEPGLDLNKIKLGDSISVNGCCLTVTKIDLNKHTLFFDVSLQTLSCTTLGRITQSCLVNLESALTPSTPMGGHYVSGHVDAVIVCEQKKVSGESLQLYFRANEWMLYIAPKGSICIDGVSLTVTETDLNGFWVNLVPHTLSKTTLSDCAIGTYVNMEIDMLARYLVNFIQRGNNNGA